MNTRLIHLKIKVKSLGAEAVINRQEAKKWKGEVKQDLNNHRMGVLREHTRLNHLAYGLLRNVPYNCMEWDCEVPPDFKKVSDLAKRFGGTEDEIALWVDEAKAHIKLQATQPIEPEPVATPVPYLQLVTNNYSG
jgi:hypothetical protein